MPDIGGGRDALEQKAPGRALLTPRPARGPRIWLATALLAVSCGFASSSRADIVPGGCLPARFPACLVPVAQSDERVIVIDAVDNGRELRVKGEDRKWAVVDISVDPTEDSLYLALHTQANTIWNFTGRVDKIKKVIVFTADDSRWGVIGVPREVCTFVAPASDAYVDEEAYRKERANRWCYSRRQCNPTGYLFKLAESRERSFAVIKTPRGPVTEEEKSHSPMSIRPAGTIAPALLQEPEWLFLAENVTEKAGVPVRLLMRPKAPVEEIDPATVLWNK